MKSLQNNLIFFIALLLTFSSNAQFSGRAEHLPGIWKYKAGTGYEIWSLNGDVMEGQGYRVNKNGDSVLIEQFFINNVNDQLTLRLETPRSTDTTQTKSNRFISKKKRKLDFKNIDTTKPHRIKIKFGFFSKSKMKIYLYYDEIPKPNKLILYKIEE